MKTIEIDVVEKVRCVLRVQVPDHWDYETVADLLHEYGDFYDWLDNERGRTEQLFAEGTPHDIIGEGMDWDVVGFTDKPGVEPDEELAAIYAREVL